MATTTTDGRLTYTVEEAGELLGVGRGTAYAAVRAGDIPSVKIGRRVLVPRHALLELLGEPVPSEATPRANSPHNGHDPAGNRAEAKTRDSGSHEQE